MKSICFFFAAALLSFPFARVLRAQPKVSDLMPLNMGQYVEYNEYDTTSLGIQHSHSSYSVDSINENFWNSSGVASVIDTSEDSDNISVVTKVHYRFNAAGDLQAFADAQLTQQVLGATLSPGATPPNRWVTEFMTSAGNAEYTIDTINTTYSIANVQVIFTGKYVGQESVTVPSAPTPYTNAQRFDLTGHATISYGGQTISQFSTTESEWLVQGIGIIKTVLPRSYVTVPIAGTDTVGGTEKEMTASGVASASVSEPSLLAASGIQFYPNPASDNVTLSFDRPARRVILYDATGRIVRSFDLATQTNNALLWVKDIPNGVYLARAQYANGMAASKKLIIQH